MENCYYSKAKENIKPFNVKVKYFVHFIQKLEDALRENRNYG